MYILKTFFRKNVLQFKLCAIRSLLKFNHSKFPLPSGRVGFVSASLLRLQVQGSVRQSPWEAVIAVGSLRENRFAVNSTTRLCRGHSHELATVAISSGVSTRAHIMQFSIVPLQINFAINSYCRKMFLLTSKNLAKKLSNS